MHCHCGTNNREPLWTFTNPCKPEARPGVREESASPAWLAAPAVNARDTKVYKWSLDTGCGLTLYRKCHSHNIDFLANQKAWLPYLWNQSEQQQLGYFNSGYRDAFVFCFFFAVAFRSEEEVLYRKGPSLTYLMRHLSCMHLESM